jgi:CxxC motif-containing protein (DUF1111 family)
MLQKEFGERDLARIRNLVNKKYTEAIGGQVGYTKQQVDHEEGDTWEENGKQWTIKNGIKMTISKLDGVKKLMQLPLACPCCGNAMKKSTLDGKMYFIHKKCFDCVIEFETKLRQEGKYEEYEKQMINNNINAYVADLEQIFDEYLLNSQESIVTESGDIEQWVGGKMDKIKEIEQFQIYINKLKNLTKDSMDS